jgi:hypothetical protein
MGVNIYLVDNKGCIFCIHFELYVLISINAVNRYVYFGLIL